MKHDMNMDCYYCGTCFLKRYSSNGNRKRMSSK
jgi:hypothetical protein